MLKGNGTLVDNRRTELENDINSIETRAHEEAAVVGSNNIWTDELIDLYTKFLLLHDPRYDAEAKRKELNYIEEHFCSEVPEEPSVDTNEY